jgi:hypothetical protein
MECWDTKCVPTLYFVFTKVFVYELINCIQMDCKPGNSAKCPMKLALSRNFKQEESLNTSSINLTHNTYVDSLAIATKSPLGAIYRCERYIPQTKNSIKGGQAFH